MPFPQDQIDRNRRVFDDKLSAFLEKIALVHKIRGEPTSSPPYLLVDARGRDAYRKEHIPGAICAPVAEISDIVDRLSRDRMLVVYCWNDY